MRRHLDEANPNQLVMVSTHRDLNTQQETVATSWFTKTGTPDLPPPVPEAVAEQEAEESEDEDAAAHAQQEEDDEDEGPEDVDPGADEESPDVPPAAIRATMGTAPHSCLKPSSMRTNSTAMHRVDLSGVWKRTSTANFEAFIGEYLCVVPGCSALIESECRCSRRWLCAAEAGSFYAADSHDYDGSALLHRVPIA